MEEWKVERLKFIPRHKQKQESKEKRRAKKDLG